jgi:hypothetical protein
MTTRPVPPDPYDIINATDPAMVVARAACAAILAKLPRHPPYRLSINHSVAAADCRGTKPKTGACPLNYDWQHGRIVGIKTNIRRVAELWIMEALGLGYEVSLLPSHHANARQDYDAIVTVSVELARAIAVRRAERRNRKSSPLSTMDDDIPF